MGKLLRAVGWTTLITVIIIGILRATVLLWWKIPTDDPQHGASLAPSLYQGDFVLLWRGTPTIGDLARCADPEAPGRYVVGRILGQAGDQIETEGTTITVNNRAEVQEQSCSPNRVTIQDPSTGADVDIHCGIATISSRKYLRGTHMNQNTTSIKRQITVGEGQFYLISDNRVFPFDSREYGGVPKASCKEFVFFRLKGLKGWGDSETRLTYIR